MPRSKQHGECPDKDWVGMINCPICNEPYALVLDRRLKKSLCRNNVDPTEVCDKCREEYLSNGVMLINPETGQLVVMKDEAFTRAFNVPLPPKKIAFMDNEVTAKMMADLMKEEQQNPKEE